MANNNPNLSLKPHISNATEVRWCKEWFTNGAY